jgi:hypothetical protein
LNRFVMAGLDPAIQPASVRKPKKDWMAASGAAMTKMG